MQETVKGLSCIAKNHEGLSRNNLSTTLRTLMGDMNIEVDDKETGYENFIPGFYFYLLKKLHLYPF